MGISEEDQKVLNELKKSSLRAQLKKSDYSIEEFEDLVKNGVANDDVGIAYLVINNEVKSEYNIFIERQCILRSGSLISFRGLLKMYGRDNIRIKYVV